MSSLIGQDPLIKLLQQHLPRVTMLVGSRGHGKKTLAIRTAKYYGVHLYIPEGNKVDHIRELIEHAQALSYATVYLISEADELTIQAQNALLKIIEEPPINAYFILTSQDDTRVLPTIRSRCVTLKLANYTPDTLSKFTDDKRLQTVCENPGQILRILENQEVLELADKVVRNIDKISAANCFNILKHLDTDDYDIFMLALRMAYSGKIFNSPYPGSTIKQLRLVVKYSNNFRNKSLHKQSLMEILFVELRQAALEGDIK